jgi:hypothetical protein
MLRLVAPLLPLDMLTFKDPFDQKKYLLVTIDVRSASIASLR